MSTNLLDLAKGALGSGGLGSIASMLGESEKQTKSAFDLAGSAILGGLIKKISAPQGAKDLFEEASKFDSGALDNIVGMLTGGGSEENKSAMTSLGTKLISSLLGSKQDSIIALIARMAGIGEGSSKSLLTMLAPLLFGTIAKQVKSGGLNLSGLTELLMSQKSVVSKSLPKDFSQQLGIANLLDEGSQAVRAGASQAKRATTETAKASSGLLKVLVPLAILAGVGFLLWKMASPAKQVAEKSIGAVESTVAAAQDAVDAAVDRVDAAADRVTLNKLAIPGVDFDKISTELTSSFGDLTKSITGISDEASAQLALPQIEDLTKAIGQYGLDKMPEEANTAFQGILRPLIEKLQAAIETASQIPGVKAILEPAVGALMKSVSAFNQTN